MAVDVRRMLKTSTHDDIQPRLLPTLSGASLCARRGHVLGCGARRSVGGRGLGSRRTRVRCTPWTNVIALGSVDPAAPIDRAANPVLALESRVRWNVKWDFLTTEDGNRESFENLVFERPRHRCSRSGRDLSASHPVVFLAEFRAGSWSRRSWSPGRVLNKHAPQLRGTRVLPWAPVGRFDSERTILRTSYVAGTDRRRVRQPLLPRVLRNGQYALPASDPIGSTISPSTEGRSRVRDLAAAAPPADAAARSRRRDAGRVVRRRGQRSVCWRSSRPAAASGSCLAGEARAQISSPVSAAWPQGQRRAPGVRERGPRRDRGRGRSAMASHRAPPRLRQLRPPGRYWRSRATTNRPCRSASQGEAGTQIHHYPAAAGAVTESIDLAASAPPSPGRPVTTRATRTSLRVARRPNRSAFGWRKWRNRVYSLGGRSPGFGRLWTDGVGWMRYTGSPRPTRVGARSKS